MTGKTTAEVAAAQDPRRKAMLMDLGIARFDEFPMEDGEGGKHGRENRISSHPDLTTGAQGVVPRIRVKSEWAKAMQRGDFDDDDAAKVSGMDSMANGQLARIRRTQAAAATASNFTNDNYNRNLRRDRNGYVPPRATIGNFGKRQVPGPIHVGDDPIDIDSALAVPAPDRRPRPTREHPISKSIFGHGAFAGGPSSQPPGRPQPAAAKPERGQTAQGAQPATQAHIRVVLPDGAAIVHQLPGRLGARMFPNPSQRYCGKVYLVSSPQPSEDLILLVVEDKNISEIRHYISQYDDHVRVSSTGLMLKFDNSKDGFNFYGVEFDSAANLDSFVQSLQNLLERRKQPSKSSEQISPAESVRKADGTAPPATRLELQQPAFGVPDKDVKPAATRRPEVAAILGKKTEPLAQEHDERKDKKAETAADMAAISKPDKHKSIAALALRPDPNTATNIEVQPVQAVNSPVLDEPILVNVNSQANKQQESQPVQTANASIQQIEGPPSLHPDLINDMIKWAWDTVSYMKHSVPEQFGFDAMRSVVEAVCAAVIGRTSPSFRRRSPAEQRKFIRDHAQKEVEGGLAKLARNEQVATESENTDMGPTRSSQQLPEVRTNAELQADSPSNLAGPVYGVEELMRMRTAAAAIDPAMLPNIPRLSPKTGIPQLRVGLARLPVEAQVQQAAAANADWLKNGAPAQEASSEVDALADFAFGQNTASPSAGLSDSIHNRRHTKLTGAPVEKPDYQKDLEELVAKSTDKGNAFDHKVVKATEGISRLSLN